jgi:hypothetical protein
MKMAGQCIKQGKTCKGKERRKEGQEERGSKREGEE